MSTTEQRAILTLALMAALADGESSEQEREVFRKMADSFGTQGNFSLWDLYQDVLNHRRSLESLVAELGSADARNLAFEMAAGICNADGPANEKEQAFLASLRTALGVRNAEPSTPAQSTNASTPVLEPVDTDAIDKMVVNYSVLNGALELLPQNLATLAIVPLQMRMVYRIGKRYGYSLDKGHIRDFLTTAGVGLAAQAVEGFARRLLGGLAGQVLGGLGRVAVGTATSATLTFASTYALGQLANRYYAGGRKMNTTLLRDTYRQLMQEGKELFGMHSDEVRQRASSMRPSDVIELARSA